MKKFLALLVVSLLGSIRTKDYWQCDSLGKFSCATNQTCCRSIVNFSGWECFPTINGVCCSNGINCCPFGTICDLSAKTCRPRNLLFLSNEDSTTEPITASNEPNITNPLDSTGEFLVGFLQGFDLFAKINEDNTCLNKEEIGKFVTEFVDRLKTIKFDDTLLKSLEELLILVDERIKNCQVLKLKAEQVFGRLARRVNQPDYLKQVSTHAFININEVKENSQKIINLAQSQEYKNLGIAVGQFVNFLFFWDL
jgi:hypothetical protein